MNLYSQIGLIVEFADQLREGRATVYEVLVWIIAGGLALVTVAKHSVTPVAYLLLAGFARPRAAETELLEAELRRASLRKYPAE